MNRQEVKKARERRALRMVVLVTQIGNCMLVPIFYCVFIGRWLSMTLNRPLLFPLVLLVGILAGFRSCWQVIARFSGLKLDRRKESEDDKVDKMDTGVE